MGMWIELGVFGLVFVFAWHQLRDLKKERPASRFFSAVQQSCCTATSLACCDK